MDILDQTTAKMLREIIKDTSEKMYLEADKIVTDYHTERRRYNLEAAKSKGKMNSSHLACRVKRNPRGPGISIEWYNDNYQKSPAPGEKRKAFSDMSPKGKSTTFLESKVFNWRTLDWEKESFRNMEPKLSLIRGYSILLGKLSKSVGNFEKGLKKLNEKAKDIK